MLSTIDRSQVPQLMDIRVRQTGHPFDAFDKRAAWLYFQRTGARQMITKIINTTGQQLRSRLRIGGLCTPERERRE
jgi:hypothetical protein